MTLDYEQLKREIVAKKQELLQRQKEIVAESREIQQQLAGLDHMMEGLEFMESGGPPPDFEELGFTEKVAHILQQTGLAIFPTQIRDELYKMGTKGSSSKNLLISVHNAIGRLKDDIEEVDIDGRTAYRWSGPLPLAMRRVPLSRLGLRLELDSDNLALDAMRQEIEKSQVFAKRKTLGQRLAETSNLAAQVLPPKKK